MKPLVRKPGGYLRENVWVTTSGMAQEPVIMFCRQVPGPDRVLCTMHHSYQ